MDSSPTVQIMIDKIQTEWSTWSSLVAQFTPEQIIQPGVAGDWSLKDVIAHITWHEREMLGLVEAHALVGSELWDLPTDDRNAVIYQQTRLQPLEQVLLESAQVHLELLEELPTLSDEDLADPGTFPDMPSDWQPWMLIAQNTYEHYQDHIRDVEHWLAEADSSPRSG